MLNFVRVRVAAFVMATACACVVSLIPGSAASLALGQSAPAPASTTPATSTSPVTSAPAQSQPASAPWQPSDAEYRPNFAAVKTQIQQIATPAAPAAANVHVQSIAASGGGREVFLLTLSNDQATAGAKPALLIVAGLDGRYRAGVETSLRMVRTIIAHHAHLLNDVTFYIVPCANPDGFDFNLAALNAGHIGNVQPPVDDDRDGAADEDGPADINGDGLITMMRRIDPPLDDHATHLPDPAEPRLLKRVEAARGERAVYSVYVEGLDTDGDGLIAEDGAGETDLDRNFTHRYPEHESVAGIMPLSAPESLAIADFVIQHKNIMAAIVYGRHDNIVNVPDGRASDVTGQGPRDLDGDDVAYYQEVAKKYKELTGHSRASGEESAGSLQAWLYAQRGIPTFASTLWGRPDLPEKPREQIPATAASAATSAPGEATIQPATQATSETQPTSQPESQPDVRGDNPAVEPVDNANASQEARPGARRPGGRGQGGRRGGGTGGSEGGSAPREAASGGDARGPGDNNNAGAGEQSASDAEAAAWLKYSDQLRNGDGFIIWKPFDHPTLGKVEIGGFVPGFQMNPPAADLHEMATKQTAFALDVISRRPRLDVQGPTVKKLADGLYEVRLGIINEGYLPTATAIARKARAVFPTVVRISTSLDNIVSGEPMTRTYGIGGSGDRATYHWIIRAEPGSETTIAITNPHMGDRVVTFRTE